jgi:KipI family sensor histidine kinase inhibitor
VSDELVRPVGDRAALLQLRSNAAVHVAARLARERYGDRLIEVVPGHQTLLLTWHAGGVISDLSELASASVAISERPDDGATLAPAITVPVRYDGADLETAAAALGLSSEAVVALHCTAEYVVAFMGFAPGFPYLLAAQASRLLELPRLETPRTEAPAGSVAVAAGYCGIYPRASPGGWNLLGRTEVVLFDARRDPPALLAPGRRVRFEPV